MPWGWLWTLIIVVTGLLDFLVRLATNFDMTSVVPAEAVLFLSTGLVLWALKRRRPARARWQGVVQGALVALFALTGLRAGLWAGGLPVARANVAIVVVGVLWGAAAVRR